MSKQYKSLTIICQSFRCDKKCPYCTAKITKWPLSQDGFVLLPGLLEKARQQGLRFNYATLSGNGEPSMNSLSELQFLRRCLDQYAVLFGGYRLQTSGYVFFNPEIMQIFSGWTFEITRVAHDSETDMKTLRYERDYVDTDAFKSVPIILNIVLLNDMNVMEEIAKYSSWSNIKAINLIILNGNTMDNGFDNPYSRWILENGVREDGAQAVVDQMNRAFALTKAYDDHYDSYEWQDAKGMPILMYARRAPYGLRNLVFYQGRFVDYHLNSVRLCDYPGDRIDQVNAKIVVDGNDGTGKTTLITALKELGYICQDRGLPTQMTDDPCLVPTEANEVYIILNASIATSRKRLALAGRDLNERYHTEADLAYYKERFLEVAKILPGTKVIDADRSIKEIIQDCVLFLSECGVVNDNIQERGK